MSIAVALHAGRYVVMGSDSRATLYDRELTAIVGTRDGCSHKLQATAHGLMTGTGYIPLLQAVIDRAGEAKGSADLLRIIAEEQQKVYATSGSSPETTRYLVESTGWLLSANGQDGSLRMAGYHQHRFANAYVCADGP